MTSAILLLLPIQYGEAQQDRTKLTDGQKNDCQDIMSSLGIDTKINDFGEVKLANGTITSCSSMFGIVMTDEEKNKCEERANLVGGGTVNWFNFVTFEDGTRMLCYDLVEGYIIPEDGGELTNESELADAICTFNPNDKKLPQC